MVQIQSTVNQWIQIDDRQWLSWDIIIHVPIVLCISQYCAFGAVQMGFSWASYCPPVGSPEESSKHSNFCKPEPQTDWRWPSSEQMLFDFHLIWNMCPQFWIDSRLWTGSLTVWLHRCQSCSGLWISLWFCEKDSLISHICVDTHVRASWMWICQCRSKLSLSVVFLCLAKSVFMESWGGFIECCWAGQWPEPACMAVRPVGSLW